MRQLRLPAEGFRYKAIYMNDAEASMASMLPQVSERELRNRVEEVRTKKKALAKAKAKAKAKMMARRFTRGTAMRK